MIFNNSDQENIHHGCHHDPFTFLGAHAVDNGTIFRAFQPHAKTIDLLINGRTYKMSEDRYGFYYTILKLEDCDLSTLTPYQYQYRICFNDGTEKTINDPYSFLPITSKDDLYLFNLGNNYQLYNHMGAHLRMVDGVNGVVFKVWAPNAKAVSVIGNFNGWNHLVHQLRSLGNSGVWELFIPQLSENEYYKFSILGIDDIRRNKADPFQFFGEIRPNTSSIIYNLNHYEWHDQEWQNRDFKPHHEQPISIYEVHLSSWRRDPDNCDNFLNYRDLAHQLVNYVQEMGFTHIELLPIMEHPLDESWGYQVTAPFSVTSRHGSPEDFMYFVDLFHQAGIGVILDWVPAHFPKDEHSLGQFDGTSLYEHGDPRLGDHPEWGTFIYNYGRDEVSNYLISNALFWLEKYHIDGLRVDAVASMLYLDYSRKDGEWVANRFGGNHNLEAIEFIKHVNTITYQYHPKALIIAEESTSFFGVSKPTNLGGLGFGFKWNMGWMNDILGYFKTDPLFRKHHQNTLTFSIMYAFSENFVLPLSHDEVVHGKYSLIDKMPGSDWQKFANLRLLYTYMWMHPGKKLLFMGGEFAQYKEWDCKASLDWHLLANEQHFKLHDFISELNSFYKDEQPLWEADTDGSGFGWLNLTDHENSIIAFVRYAKNAQDHLVCIFNFTPQPQENYLINLPTHNSYIEIFSSDSKEFGGTGDHSNHTVNPLLNELDKSVGKITIPPLGGIVLKPDPSKKL